MRLSYMALCQKNGKKRLKNYSKGGKRYEERKNYYRVSNHIDN